MDKTESALNVAENVESLVLEGFKMVEKDKPVTVDELKAPVVGIYKAMEKSTHSNVYVVETKAGTKAILGCTDLDSQMKKVVVGQEIAIVFEGKSLTKKGHPFYEVQVLFK